MRWAGTGWRHREPSAGGWLAAAGTILRLSAGGLPSRVEQGLCWVGGKRAVTKVNVSHFFRCCAHKLFDKSPMWLLFFFLLGKEPRYNPPLYIHAESLVASNVALGVKAVEFANYVVNFRCPSIISDLLVYSAYICYFW
jgi:hypothetical protein